MERRKFSGKCKSLRELTDIKLNHRKLPLLYLKTHPTSAISHDSISHTPHPRRKDALKGQTTLTERMLRQLKRKVQYGNCKVKPRTSLGKAKKRIKMQAGKEKRKWKMNAESSTSDYQGSQEDKTQEGKLVKEKSTAHFPRGQEHVSPDGVGSRAPRARGRGVQRGCRDEDGSPGPLKGEIRGGRWRPGLRMTTGFSLVMTELEFGEKGPSAWTSIPRQTIHLGSRLKPDPADSRALSSTSSGEATRRHVPPKGGSKHGTWKTGVLRGQDRGAHRGEPCGRQRVKHPSWLQQKFKPKEKRRHV